MVALITGIIQIVFLILQKVFEKDSEKKKKIETVLTELSNALKSKDASAINLAILHGNRL